MGSKAHPGPTPVPATLLPATLLIESGPHAGAKVALDGKPCRVGRGGDNEVVLVDDLLATVHFMLGRHGGGFQLHALGGPVAAGGGMVQAGQSAPCADGEAFQAGGTAFRFTLPPAPAAVLPRRFRRGAVVTGVTCAAIILVAAAMGAAGSLSAPEAHAAAPASAPGPARPAKASKPVEVAGLLGEHLAAEGLGNIALTALPDGSVEAAGEIMAQQAGAWREAKRWFDAGLSGQAVLVDHVAKSAAAPPLVIQAVWPGANPYVIDASGQKLFAGAALRSGWTVERILADRVVIRRGAQALAVRF